MLGFLLLLDFLIRLIIVIIWVGSIPSMFVRMRAAAGRVGVSMEQAALLPPILEKRRATQPSCIYCNHLTLLVPFDSIKADRFVF